MAAWQFDVYFIARGASVPNLDAECWETPSLPLATVYEVQEELAHYLGPPWLMLPDWVVFGPENGNRVDVVSKRRHRAAYSFDATCVSKSPSFSSWSATLRIRSTVNFLIRKTGRLSSRR